MLHMARFICHDAHGITALLLLQIEEWRVRRAGSLRICSSQMEFAKSLLGSSSKGRSPELQSLRRAARSVSDLLRPGMPSTS